MGTWLVAFTLLICLDMLWFSYSFKRVYEPQFKKIQKRVFLRIWSAIFVWLLLSLAISMLLKQTKRDPVLSGWSGVLLGLIIYGVYNFTNYATLVHYKFNVALIDSIWGGFVMGFVSFLIAFGSNNFKL